MTRRGVPTRKEVEQDGSGCVWCRMHSIWFKKLYKSHSMASLGKRFLAAFCQSLSLFFFFSFGHNAR